MSVRVPKLVMLRRLHDRGLIHQGGEGSTRSTTLRRFIGEQLTACLIQHEWDMFDLCRHRKRGHEASN
jgi:hypothetical protein